MKNFTKSLLWIGFLFWSLGIQDHSTNAQNLKTTNQEKKLEQMKIRKYEIQSYLEKSYFSEQNVLKQMKKLSRSIEDLKGEIVQTVIKQKHLENILIRQKKEIERLKHYIDQDERSIRKRIRSIYRYFKGKQALSMIWINFDYSPKKTRLMEMVLQHEMSQFQKLNKKRQALDQLLGPYQKRKLTQVELHQDKLKMEQQLVLKQKEHQQILVNIQQDRQIYYQFLDEVQQKMEAATEILDHLKNQEQLASKFKKATGLWPLKGKLRIPLEGRIIPPIQSNGSQPSLQRGIFIENPIPSFISAVAPGKVVYADHLQGYLLLVIVDHGKNSYSVYGKLDELHVKVGDFVDTKTRIGKVALDPVFSSYRAYFEIRYQGKWFNPLDWIRDSDIY